MRLLHTSDWHVGKTMRGLSRLDEHRAVLADIVAVSRAADVDAVLITGDLYESAVPSPQAQRLVVRTLVELADRRRRKVFVIAGNHDNGGVFDAYRDVMAAAGITVCGLPRGVRDGGCVRFTSRAGEPVRLALLPFLSQHAVVRALELLGGGQASATAAYEQALAGLVRALTADFDRDSVNLVAAHTAVRGARLGGGERQVQSVLGYVVSPMIFPRTASYVALGHVHRMQRVPARGGPPIWYPGSPVAVDFGDIGPGGGSGAPAGAGAGTGGVDERYALLVEAAPGAATRVQPRPLAGGKRLVTLTGTVAELERTAAASSAAFDQERAWLRVFVQEPARAGLADAVRTLLPNAVEVRVDPMFLRREPPGEPADATRRRGRGERELFADYLASVGVADPELLDLFGQMIAEVQAEAAAAVAARA